MWSVSLQAAVEEAEVVEKELFDLATSVWADRATTSESKDFLDKPRVERICFEKDWNRIYTKSVRACVCSPLLRSNDFVFCLDIPCGQRSRNWLESEAIGLKDPKKLEEVCSVIRANYGVISLCFEFYASFSISNTMPVSMDKKAYLQWIDDAEIIDKV